MSKGSAMSGSRDRGWWRTIARAAAAFGLVCVAACVEPALSTPPNELVLRPGDVLTANTPEGDVRVQATSALGRDFSFADRSVHVDLGPRDARWYGSFGAYGQSEDLVADEGQYTFDSERPFRFWLRDRPNRVFSRDGYVVEFGKAPNGNTDIDVYHVCIAGTPVSDLRGGNDHAVHVNHVNGPDDASAKVSYGCARQPYDPVAQARADVRNSLDIARQVNFWHDQDGCAVTGQEGTGDPPLGPTPGRSELVLRPGVSLRARNINGSVTISAADEQTRTLGWFSDNPRPDGFRPQTDLQRTITVAMRPEPERNAGTLGMYACTRIAGNSEYVADFDEAALDFANVNDFHFWMTWITHGRHYMDYVYRNDGLLVGFELGHDSGMDPMINVALYRICIGGKSPTHLPGARDAAITMQGVGSTSHLVGHYGCAAKTFYPRAIYANYQRYYTADATAIRMIETYDQENAR